jgi:hypothetical protein
VVLNGPRIQPVGAADGLTWAQHYPGKFCRSHRAGPAPLYGGPANGLKWAQQQLIDSVDGLDWTDLKGQA